MCFDPLATYAMQLQYVISSDTVLVMHVYINIAILLNIIVWGALSLETMF